MTGEPPSFETALGELEEAVEANAAGQGAATDDERGIARESPFRSHLAPIATPSSNLVLCLGTPSDGADRREPAASLAACARARSFQITYQLEQVLAMRRR